MRARLESPNLSMGHKHVQARIEKNKHVQDRIEEISMGHGNILCPMFINKTKNPPAAGYF